MFSSGFSSGIFKRFQGCSRSFRDLRGDSVCSRVSGVLQGVPRAFQEMSGAMQSVSGGIKRFQKVTCAFQGWSKVSVGIRGVLMFFCVFQGLRGVPRISGVFTFRGVRRCFRGVPVDLMCFQGGFKVFQEASGAFQGCSMGISSFQKCSRGIPGDFMGISGFFRVTEVFQWVVERFGDVPSVSRVFIRASGLFQGLQGRSSGLQSI